MADEKTIHDIPDVSDRRLLAIEQLPEQGITIIEGTRYSNALLILLGQDGIYEGPFVIERRGDGVIHLRTITRWPES